ncbi:hypothetical protein C5E51_36245 [Nocardia nova]|uniref:hypothetical protein n=1 Tax=Nocardia nova TaxID=37330 RepID=UPI000CEA3418|nr:hypothetical protein [Nocardia nova]PPI99530.1 hypothetical protein C5E51_36245 [Nocardia nova]
MARDIHGIPRHHASDLVRFEFFGPAITLGRATDIRSIHFFGGGYGNSPLGQLRYLICHECRRGFIGNIDVDRVVQSRGVATRALACVREPLPGYLWRTSVQFPDSQSFWQLIAERTGEDYADADSTCEHMEPHFRGGVTYAPTNHDRAPEWFQMTGPGQDRR